MRVRRYGPEKSQAILVLHRSFKVCHIQIIIKLSWKTWPKRTCKLYDNRPLSRSLDRCDRVIQDESCDSNGGNVYYVTMRITFVTRKFGNVERNSHCDVLHITPVRIARLVLDCNGVFAIKAYRSNSQKKNPLTQ